MKTKSKLKAQKEDSRDLLLRFIDACARFQPALHCLSLRASLRAQLLTKRSSFALCFANPIWSAGRCECKTQIARERYLAAAFCVTGAQTAKQRAHDIDIGARPAVGFVLRMRKLELLTRGSQAELQIRVAFLGAFSVLRRAHSA